MIRGGFLDRLIACILPFAKPGLEIGAKEQSLEGL